nr:hypothetical protein [Tamaricihabitans halophyticus]
MEQLRTPLLAALGAGNLASQAVADVVAKAKERANEGTEAARKTLDDLPSDAEGLRERLDPNELRRLIEDYTDAAVKLYNRLAEQGEEAWTKLSAQPQVKQALDQLEEAIHTAQGRVENAADDARDLAEDVLGKVTKRTRSAGEKTARRVQQVASETAEKVEDFGDDMAEEARSVSRKAANKTAPRGTGSTTKKASGGKSTGQSATQSKTNNGRKASGTGTKTDSTD